MKNNSIFFLSLSLVTVLFIISLIIFGFDISTPKNGRRALTRIVENESTVNRFYKINDEFAFGVFTDREPGEMDVTLTTYERNIVPYCFFCGWYTGTPDDNRHIVEPYLANGYVYSINLYEENYGGVPAGQYALFNMETGEFGHTGNLNSLINLPMDPKNKITREFVSENYDEISYFGPDDEDCMAVFTALLICYAVLLIWGSVIFVRKVVRK